MKTMKCYTMNVVDKASAIYFLCLCIEEIGGGFHPDTKAEDYVDFVTHKPLFEKLQSILFNENMNQTFKYLKDPYEVGLALQDILKNENGGN